METHGTDKTIDRTPTSGEPEVVRDRLDPQRPLGLNEIPTETPEDVAILYSWANVPGAKYRDFSATRREYRAQMRRNAAGAESEAQPESGSSVATPVTPAASIAPPASPASLSTPEPPPLVSAAAPVDNTTAVNTEPQPEAVVQLPSIEPDSATPIAAPVAPPLADSYAHLQQRAVSEALAMHANSLDRQREQDLATAPAIEPEAQPTQEPISRTSAPPSQTQPFESAPAPRSSVSAPTRIHTAPPSPVDIPDGPAWLYSPQEPFRNRPKPVEPKPVAAQPSSRIADTLQSSKERVAARWYALKGVFQQNPPNLSYEGRELPHDGNRPPVLAVFSLAGGVGKTSLVATLGRSLSAMGERVLLADTTTHGLLPYYFGANEVHPGVIRTFWPPPGCKDAAVQLVNYDVDRRSELQSREERKSQDGVSHDKLLEDLTRNSRGSHRVLLDLAATSSWVVRRVARMNPTILLPIAADMNSVITLRSVTRFFQSILDSEGKPLQPYFVLNQFDNKLPLHLDVREVLVQQLGDRLLPFVLHRSPAMSEALAEGMTIIDYDPDSIVVQDYLQLANWIRSVSAPVAGGYGNIRWSEK